MVWDLVSWAGLDSCCNLVSGEHFEGPGGVLGCDFGLHRCDPVSCDPSRHLQECPGTRAGKCFSSDFGRLARSAPKSASRRASWYY